ncbi:MULTISPECIES: 3'-5' exoribonuclease [unclassified Massilia]|uniref:3'-5' exoribonuclease n=1 Tax=unclassified Massilia TaxID=2609279 RepID=UPI0013A5995F|nr:MULTISPECIES: 3'-5' exoribonuclease [unclassified Massilia]
MLIFLDTEFTSLEEPYLVSAGLVAGDRELYFELAGVSPEICSPFVQTTVLPLLGGPVLEPIEVSRQLAKFLESCSPSVTFFCDAPSYDIVLLTPFLPSDLRWKFAVPSFRDHPSEQFFNQTQEEAFANGLRRHHALDDAKALAAAWAKVDLP